MDNVIYPTAFHTRITSGSYSDNLNRLPFERIPPISTKPAYVTQNATLNRVITDLELRGWHIECRPCGEITALHPQVKTVRPRPITLMEAQQVQRILEGNTK